MNAGPLCLLAMVVSGVLLVSAACAPLQKRLPLRDREAPVDVVPGDQEGVQFLPCTVVIEGERVRIEPEGPFDASIPVICL